MVEGGMTCVKYLLFAFNLIFFLIGLALIIVGIVVQVAFKDYVDFFGSGVLSAPAILVIVVGVIIFLIGFFGCCGAVKENYCMVMTFAALMVIIFILELAAGITGFVLKDALNEWVSGELKKTQAHYEADSHLGNTTRKIWDAFQNDSKCCGVNNASDWADQDLKKQLNYFPDSCCNGAVKVGCKPYHVGCLPHFENFLTSKVWIVAGVGIAFALIQIVGIVFACMFGRAVNKEYEVV